MKENKTIFDYLAQILMVFGFTILVLNLFCLLFGDSAKDFSTMFALGSQGIPVKTAFEFLCQSALITGLQFLFFTDVLIKKMPIWARTVCMLTLVVIVMAVFIVLFAWFPVDMWQPWVMFFLCFGISFLGSCAVMAMKEKAENRKMEEALERMKMREQCKKGGEEYE